MSLREWLVSLLAALASADERKRRRRDERSETVWVSYPESKEEAESLLHQAGRRRGWPISKAFDTPVKNRGG